MYLKRICFLLAMLLISATAFAAPTVPAPNMVTMVDIGSKNCIPCKMMAPILEKLEKDYEGKAAIILFTAPNLLIINFLSRSSDCDIRFIS